jgi:hypothetical protein
MDILDYPFTLGASCFDAWDADHGQYKYRQQGRSDRLPRNSQRNQ